MTFRKKLIEHSLPLEAINAASSREKSARHGHPSTLHLWWARRPLAACRAVIFAQLVDDPSGWPELFPDEDSQDRERRRLHRIIENMVEWPKSNAKDQQRFSQAINAARYEIVRSIAREKGIQPPKNGDHQATLNFLQEEGPKIHDPFCGGGAIPLEAQRLGLPAFGSDLNPVAVLITKALIELPARFSGLEPVHPTAAAESNSGRDLAGRTWKGAEGISEDVRNYGLWLRSEAEKRVGHLYPKAVLADGSEATVIAWLWCRTVTSPDPAQSGAQVPLASSFLLSGKKGKEAIAKPVRDPNAPDGWRFEVKAGKISKEEMEEAKAGTVQRSSGGTCILSGANMPFAYLREQGKNKSLGTRLMAIVAEGPRGRIFLSPDHLHEDVAELEDIDPPILGTISHWPGRTNVVEYGMTEFSDLFTTRQLTTLKCLSDLVAEARAKIHADAEQSAQFDQRDNSLCFSDGGSGAQAYADVVATYLGMLISQLTNQSAAVCGWNAPNTQMRSVFARQAIPMVWDFAESNVFSQSTGSYHNMWERLVKGVASLKDADIPGSAFLAEAQSSEFSNLFVLSTDPPYYDNIGYADLSDFFYLWLRRTLKDIHPSLFRRLVTPKTEELIAMPYRHGGAEKAERFFIEGMELAMRSMRERSLELPLTIFYAFKQSEIEEDGIFSPGWSAFLSAVIRNGLQIDGTWPMRTEKPGRVISIGSNALASSVVLVCRKRPDDAPTINRRDFQRELRIAMKQALADQQETIPLPDRRQAAIGPGIGVFSKYTKVREADDSEMSVGTALTLINREIDTILAEGTESLDPESRFALEWYRQHGFAEIKGGAGSAISQLQGFNLTEGQINRSGLFRAASGNAKLLTRNEMAVTFRERHGKEWRPSHDDTPTAWEMAQHLARVLEAEDGGIEACGRLLAERRDAGPDVLLIAERLYDHENTHGKATEALVWNELQQAWPAIASAADRAEADGVGPKAQQEELRL